MVSYISADRVYPVSHPPIDHGVLAVADDGRILAVLTPEDAAAQKVQDIKHFKGVLVPGFVNTHCHLELSHLHGQLEEKTGIIHFIKGILASRDRPEEEIVVAMEKADQEMLNNGIVAVGDISNLAISKAVKLNSKIYYHTFVEIFGFNAPAEQTYASGLQLKEQFEPLKASVVPHAPYSVSAQLFQEIERNIAAADLISIHNQETVGENELFLTGTGVFADFFASLGISPHAAQNSGKNALHYHLPELAIQNNTLLVHNTFCTADDLAYAKNLHPKLYWCLCPNANMYIEGTLPDVKLFIDADVKITLGTDSLASNHQLSIVSEMATLQKHQGIGFENLLKWATLNGAEFLGISNQFGSLTKGKKPGIVLLQLQDDHQLTEDTKIERLY